jgi:hypothetical protein
MKLTLLALVCVLLVSCSSTGNILASSPCFDSQQEAADVGNDIMNMGFNNRVSYWVTGDSNNTIIGLGLMYGGFDPKPYCPEGGYPIIVWLDNNESGLDIKKVKSWSEVTLKLMLKERKKD